MRAEYHNWLESQKYQANTITAQLHRVGRVEEYHGNLDQHYENDGMLSLIKHLTYTTDDQRHKRSNPSKIPFDGDKRKNLASYKAAGRHFDDNNAVVNRYGFVMNGDFQRRQ